MSLAGNLNTMSFADLLQFISANQNTGTLQIRKGHIIKMIFFEKGKIISSSSSDPKDYLGHFLVSQGLITEEELRIAMEIQRSSKMLLGKILVMGGKITEQEMVRLLKSKTEEMIYSLFLWDEGDFTFYHDEFVNRLFVRISLDPQSLIFEGVMRRDEWQRIRQAFPTNSIVLRKVSAEESSGPFESQIHRILNMVDGRRTIDDIALAVHSVDYKICRTLFALYDAGYVDIAGTVPDISEEKPVPEDFSMMQLLEAGKDRIAKGRYEEALDLLKAIDPKMTGYQKGVAPLIQQAEQGTIEEIHSRYFGPERILEIAVTMEEVESLKLTPQEGFVLSRLDGNWDIASIVSVTPMKEVDVLRLLKRLMDRSIVTIKV